MIAQKSNALSPNTPKLFIIIPIYNVEKYLAECLDSVRMQTYPNFEAVLVDDGSKDNSAQIAQRYAQNNPNFTLLSQENKGLGEARNTALDYIFAKNPAPTDYIGSVDSDDVVARDYFANLIYCLESQDTLVAKTRNMQRFYDDDYDKNMFSATLPRQKGIMRRINDKTISSKIEFVRSVYRASLLEHLRFPPVRFAEDVALGVCINALAKNIALTKSARYFYRQRARSLTKTTQPPQEFFNVFGFIYKFFLENNLLHAFRLPTYILQPIGERAYLAGSNGYLPALQNFIRSLDIAPDVLEKNGFLKQALESSDMQDFLRRTEDSKKRFKDYFNIRMTKNKKLIKLFGKTIFDNSRENLPIESSPESKSVESANKDFKNMDSKNADSKKVDSIKADSSTHTIGAIKSTSKNKSQIFYILRDITESGGGERVCVNLANALIERGKSVHIISLFRLNDKPCYTLDPRIPITYLSHTSPSYTSPNTAKSLKKLWIKLVYRWILCLKACSIINAHARQALADTSAHAGTITALGNDGWFIPLRKLKIKGKNAIKYARIWHIQAPKKARKALSFFDLIIILSPRQITTWRTFHKHIKIIPNFLPKLPSKTTNHAQHRILAVGRLSGEKGFLRLLDIWAMVRERIEMGGTKEVHAEAESSAKSSTDSSALDLSLRVQRAKQSLESIESTNAKSSQNSLAHLRDWQLVIVGDGVQKAELEQKIINKRLQDSVVMKPFTSDIESEYLRASIYALSSRNEGFAMVLMEAGSYAIPSVAFDVDAGPSDIIDDGVNGYLVKDGDLSAFAERLLALMDDEAKRKSMGNKAREMMQERFGKEVIMRLWDEVLG